MVKKRFFFSLALVPLLVAACAPAASTAAPGKAETSPAVPTISPSPAAEVNAETLSPAPLPIATSRGPELHATDPTTVSLAAGDLQLVEFFRFT